MVVLLAPCVRERFVVTTSSADCLELAVDRGVSDTCRKNGHEAHLTRRRLEAAILLCAYFEAGKPATH